MEFTASRGIVRDWRPEQGERPDLGATRPRPGSPRLRPKLYLRGNYPQLLLTCACALTTTDLRLALAEIVWREAIISERLCAVKEA